MNAIQRIIKNTGVELISNVINLFLSAIFVFVVARMLGPSLYGKFSFVTTFPLLFVAFVTFGLDCLFIRDISRDKSRGSLLLSNALIFQISIACFIYLLVILALKYMEYKGETVTAVYIFTFFCIINSLSSVNSSLFRSLEKMEYNAILNTSEKLLVLIFGVLALSYGSKLIGLVLVFLAIGIVKLIVTCFLVFKRFVSLHLSINTGLWRYFVKEGFPIALSSFFTSFRWSIIVVLLSKLMGDYEVGVYNAAFKLCYPFLFLTFAYSTAILPVMSVFYKDSAESLGKLYKISCKLAVVFTLPISFLTTIYAQDLILLVFGSEFKDSARVLSIIIWILPFSFVIYPLGNVLVSINKQKLPMISNGINSLFLFLLCILMIREYGFVGAGASLVIAEGLLALDYYWNVIKNFGAVSLTEVIAKPGLALIFMGVVLFAAEKMGLVIGVSLGLLTYVISIYYLKIFDGPEIDRIKESLSYKSIKLF